MTARIQILAKAPVAGRVKTRLIPALGAEGAAALAAGMLAATVARALEAGLGIVELVADPDPGHPDWAGWLPGPPVILSAQGEGDLGQRLAFAAARAIDSGPVMLIGTDCLDLTADGLGAAAARLADHDCAIVPAADGGFVLLGLRRFHPSIFAGIAWSTEKVAAQVIDRIRRLGWSLHIGPTLRDVDLPADLDAWPGADRPASEEPGSPPDVAPPAESCLGRPE